MTAALHIELPWPPAALSSNARHGHWGGKAKATKRFRDSCRTAALAVTRGRSAPDAPLRVELECRPPTRRKRDGDNMLARMKAGLDGVADALGVNDTRFRIMPPRIGEPAESRLRARVLLTITLDGEPVASR